ncbi:MAG: transaldolase [Patescibacteria group bacterium]|nr:transaldolase [Patescibacteria group bacterium]
MRPAGLKTRIFLDSGDVGETKEILKALGFLDGQTTNPTYFSKSAVIQERLKSGQLFTLPELLKTYRQTVEQVSALIPQGSVSIEVYADSNTPAETMFRQAKEMFTWIPNAHIKFPIIPAGMRAAHMALEAGLRINMTLCFNQEQAAAVYALTRGAKPGDVFVSPFMGRHIDAGRSGVDFVRNVIKMYRAGDGHVQVLAASLRHLEELYAAVAAGADIVTAGTKFLRQWGEKQVEMPAPDFVYDASGLSAIPYVELPLDKAWDEYNIQDPMTDNGLQQFSSDWNALLQK